MSVSIEHDFTAWQQSYESLYGAAATPQLHAQQHEFAGGVTDEIANNAALYQRVIGREARHSLGEYFTPPSLAAFVLDKLEYLGQGSLLDPAAGLGVFLRCALERGGHPHAILGYEINPLTAASARACGLGVETRDTLCDSGQRRFDFIAGNPPWVNWRYLVPGYRDRVAPLWAQYGLAPQRGLRARLGAGMDDISILFTYLCADRLLAPGGRMGLLLSKTLLQSAGGARGFRRFELPGSRYLRVKAIHEIEGGLPFPGATNQTIAAIFEVSQQPTVYPVAYFRGGERLLARPVTTDPVSPWMITSRGRSRLFEKLRGASPYSARVGVHTGGATGVYWVDIVEQRPQSLVIRNRHAAGRTRCAEVEVEVEPDLVRSLIRGRDVTPWTVAPSCHIVLPHGEDGKPVTEFLMQQRWPRTFAYFERFRGQMLDRPHYRQHFARTKSPYWSMYNVGAYTFAPHRIVWREQGSVFACAVVEDAALVADAKLVVLPCGSSEEAFYVSAMLGSTIAREFLKSFLLRVQMSTHVLRHIRLPKFDQADARHCDLAACARRQQQGPMDAIAEQVWLR